MENSILRSIKKVLGLDYDYLAFDQDVIMHINATFSVLSQLGIGPTEGYTIEDDSALWDDYDLGTTTLSFKGLVKTYMYLKVRMLFDPPTMSFLIEAMNRQIQEYEWRINVFRETEFNGVTP